MLLLLHSQTKYGKNVYELFLLHEKLHKFYFSLFNALFSFCDDFIWFVWDIANRFQQFQQFPPFNIFKLCDISMQSRLMYLG